MSPSVSDNCHRPHAIRSTLNPLSTSIYPGMNCMSGGGGVQFYCVSITPNYIIRIVHLMV